MNTEFWMNTSSADGRIVALFKMEGNKCFRYERGGTWTQLTGPYYPPFRWDDDYELLTESEFNKAVKEFEQRGKR